MGGSMEGVGGLGEGSAKHDQVSATSPAPAGPCAACTKSSGMCGLCKRRQELAC